MFVKRNLRYPLFSTFDAPDRSETCARRHVSTNAPQALTLLNGKITLDLARAFAGRVLREAGGDAARMIEFAFRLALGRLPDGDECTKMSAFLAKETGLLRDRLVEKKPVALPVPAASIDPALAAAVVDLCHALLNLNEFLYVD